MSATQSVADTAAVTPHPRYSFVQYLPLFLLFMAVLIAAYFYLERAKKRGTDSVVSTSEPTEPTDSTPAP
jgi:hypothetical protein